MAKLIDPSSYLSATKRQIYPCNRPCRPTGLWEVDAPTFSLDNALKEGCKVVCLMRLTPFTPQVYSCIRLSYRLSRPQGHSAAGRIRQIEKIHLIGTRTRDLPALYDKIAYAMLSKFPCVFFASPFSPFALLSVSVSPSHSTVQLTLLASSTVPRAPPLCNLPNL
jgi:hypothetical protein